MYNINYNLHIEKKTILLNIRIENKQKITGEENEKNHNLNRCDICLV